MMNIRLTLLSICCLMILGSCNSSQIKEVEGTGEYEGFVLSPIPNTDGYVAEKRDAGLNVIENGIIKDGMKDGPWMTYYTDERGHIKTLTNYIDGVKNGVSIEFNSRGQVEKREAFINNQLHGMVAVYKLGRPSTATEYKYGQFHGKHIEYYQAGGIQKLVEFKNGKQDGILRYFDEEGKITLEYEYKDGEKVSGGMIENEGNTSEN
ncbi:MAG: hypothetical protein HKN68_03830 [Saprospiraceae bacterium]|nr:hypothetical protein [Saprospiraceae bacterium]